MFKLGKIIDRYILREISFPFFTSLITMTFVLILGKILKLMDLMVNKGVSITDILKLLLFLLPYFLLFTIPISLLISILIGVGRLSGDNEITVLKGAGLSLYRLSRPIAWVSGIAFLITLSLSVFFVPYSNHEMKNLLFTIVRQNAGAGIKEKIFNDNFMGILLYANNIPPHGKYMEGVLISDNRISKEPSTIVAERGYLISDPQSMRVILRLETGSTHTFDFKSRSYRKMDFSTYDINLDIEEIIAEANKNKEKNSTEMTPRELREKIKTAGLDAAAKRELAVELNKKFTFPMTCFIFGLLGMTIGVTVRKSVKARGLTIGIVIVLLYYLVQLCGSALTETGVAPPWLGMWFPNIIFTIMGVWLFVMTARERNFEMDGIITFIKNLIKRKQRHV